MQFKKICLLLFLSISCFGCKQEEKQPFEIQVIPIPKHIQKSNGYFILNSKTIVEFPEEFEVAGKFLEDLLSKLSINTNSGTSNRIVFILNSEMTNEEAYHLEIKKKLITISAKTRQAAFYGVQTIRQLLPASFELDKAPLDKVKIPCLNIEDEPKFSYRGMHLDVSRHMYSIEFIKKYIDAMAMLKMNKFHWHLTDDQGWRIEIKKYPKLNEISSFREETLVGHYNDQPHQFDGKIYGGFYTQDQIKDLIAYAKERMITVIPEIEMPGHSQAVIAAYPELGCTGESVEVATKWGVFEEIYCVTEETFEFLENVLDEVMKLFPSKYIHIGGDEAPKIRWKNSQVCQALIKAKGLANEQELQSYFIKRIETYLNSKGREIIGWDEILEGGLAPNATVMSWRGTKGAIEAAKSKHDVVMTPTSHCYFDYYQSENEDEPLAIGGFLPLDKVYHFNPVPDKLTKEESKYILGAQGNLWTEYMPSENQVEYMAFPRMLALSEVVWSGTESRDYIDFVKRLEYFHERLDNLNINYANHLYDLNGKMISEDTTQYFKLETLTDGKEIRYTLNGTSPKLNSTLYKDSIPVLETMTISAAVFDNEKQIGKTYIQPIKLHKAIGAKISIDKNPHKAYLGSGAEGLINGIRGNDNRYGDKEWLGFWGDDIEILIEFKEEIEMNSIKTRFYNGNGQWIYAPRFIDLDFVSAHGVKLRDKIELETNEGKIVNMDYQFNKPENSSVKVKKITLSIPNYGKILEGKQGAGNKAWTFIDEIIVN
ncbi:MAG: family 20 glycosylhydrolase [Bacteroidota bacterium]